MKIEDFISQARAEASRRRYVPRVEIAEEGVSTAKVSLVARPELKVQLYHNARTGTSNTALILQEEYKILYHGGRFRHMSLADCATQACA